MRAFGIFSFLTSQEYWQGVDAHFDSNRARIEPGAHMDEKQLEHLLERLSLVHQALWSLLKEKTQLTDDDLRKQLAAQPAAGDAVGEDVGTCPACKHQLPPHQLRCQYCGYDMVTGQQGGEA